MGLCYSALPRKVNIGDTLRLAPFKCWSSNPVFYMYLYVVFLNYGYAGDRVIIFVFWGGVDFALARLC